MANFVDEWEVGEGKLDGGYLGVFSKKTGETIARVSPLAKMTEGDIIHAYKMAASNELYAVVKELEESSSYWSDYDVPIGIVDRIRAALAKAEWKENG